MDVASERAMQVLLERDDWVFYLEFDRLVCVCGEGLQSLDDLKGRLDAVTQLADLIPHFVEQDRAAQLPTLPDGTAFDPRDSESRQKMKDAVLAMTPEQRQQFLAGAVANGTRFLAGMLGKELPPDVVQRLQERVSDEEEKDERR